MKVTVEVTDLEEAKRILGEDTDAKFNFSYHVTHSLVEGILRDEDGALDFSGSNAAEAIEKAILKRLKELGFLRVTGKRAHWQKEWEYSISKEHKKEIDDHVEFAVRSYVRRKVEEEFENRKQELDELVKTLLESEFKRLVKGEVYRQAQETALQAAQKLFDEVDKKLAPKSRKKTARRKAK